MCVAANFERIYLCNGYELAAHILIMKGGCPDLLSADGFTGEVPLALRQRQGGGPPPWDVPCILCLSWLVCPVYAFVHKVLLVLFVFARTHIRSHISVTLL